MNVRNPTEGRGASAADSSTGALRSSDPNAAARDVVVQADAEVAALFEQLAGADTTEAAALLEGVKRAAQRGSAMLDTVSGMHALHLRTLETIIGNMKA